MKLAVVAIIFLVSVPVFLFLGLLIDYYCHKIKDPR